MSPNMSPIPPPISPKPSPIPPTASPTPSPMAPTPSPTPPKTFPIPRGRSVSGIEETWRSFGRQRLTRDSRLDTGHGVPTVLKDFGDVADFLRPAHRIE